MYRQFLVHWLPSNRNSHKSILVSLPWLTLKDTQEDPACFFIRPSFLAQEFIITSLLKLLTTELILKFLPWISKSSFAWSYLAFPALSLIICLQELFVLISPMFSFSTKPCVYSPCSPHFITLIQAAPLSWVCPFLPLCQAKSSPSVIP